MAADGKVVFEITADDAPLKKTVNQTESWLKKLDLGNIFDFSIGSMLADAVGNIGTALKDFATESVGLASDLQEVQNVVDVTFGDDAKTIETWSKKANKQFGLTELQAKKYTSTLGAMMKSSGLTGKAVTTMSTDLAGLAADMASFYNLDFDTAFEKIRSGISGETEPLKQLGINLSVANLEAFALAQGITKSYESMSQAEQVTLRYNYLMSATADAQGDFARTSDSLANSQRLLSTNLDTLKANIGEALLPVINSAVGAVNDLFAALTPEVDITGTLDQIEQDYEASLEEINSKEFTALGLIDELERLGQKTSLTSAEQLEWNATLEKLAETIPDVSEYINLQTGEIEGGTEALRDNVEAWAENAKEQAYVTAMQSKFDALAEAQVSAAEAQVDYTVSWKEWQASVDQMGTALDDITDAAGLQRGALDHLKNSYELIDASMQQAYGLSDEQAQAYNTAAQSAMTLNDQTYALGETLKQQNADLEEATERLDAEKEAYYELTGAQSETLQSVEQMTTALQGQADFLTSGALDEALANIETYLTETFNAYRKSLDSVHGLFDAVAYDPEEDARTGDEIQGALNRNVEYWTEYEANLNAVKARLEALGLDAGFLADFADGSEESAGVLAGLVSMSDAELQSMAETQQAISDAKDSIATALTELKASADEEFTAMIEKWEELAESFNQQQAATTNITLTANAVTGGLQTLYASVSGYVTSINAKLGEIGSVSLSELSMPSMNIATSTRPGNRNSVDGMHSAGLDYVPFDGYVAMLHRGETVLNAEAASLWRAGRAQDIDYRAMAAAFWQGMPPDIFGSVPAPQVYVGLDGNEIASRVSIQQGQEYKTYERSGWSAPV